MWVVRHAHAAADSPLGDVGRRLDHRGRSQVGRVADRLAELVGDGSLRRPDVLATSPAARARQTAKALARVLGLGAPDVETAFYLADADDLLAWVRSLADDVTVVAVVGHNPAVGDLAALLAGPDAVAAGFPTAAVAVIDVGTGPWSTVTGGGGTLVRSVLA